MPHKQLGHYWQYTSTPTQINTGRGSAINGGWHHRGTGLVIGDMRGEDITYIKQYLWTIVSRATSLRTHTMSHIDYINRGPKKLANQKLPKKHNDQSKVSVLGTSYHRPAKDNLYVFLSHDFRLVGHKKSTYSLQRNFAHNLHDLNKLCFDDCTHK